MASNIMTEEEIIRDLKDYIASKKLNRASVLAPIKRVNRTQRICDFVFSNPEVFKLGTEIKHVPINCITEDILVKLVLSDPENIALLSDELISTPVMVAFEFSKRKHEHMSARTWGIYGLKVKYPQKIYDVRDSISDLCDEFTLKYSDNIDLLESHDLFINKVAEYLLEFFKDKENPELKQMEKVIVKYHSVDITTEKRVLVLISGVPDSGKTTFGRMLSSRINNSVSFDSDQLAARGREFEPLSSLVSPNVHVVIFSDPNANIYFREKDMEEYDVVNIVIVPCSIEKMYRHSKYCQVFSYDEYSSRESHKVFYEGYYRDITVTNDYDERLWTYVDKTLEDMSILLDFPLIPIEDNKKLERQQQ